jgi:hypothetical protein
MAYKNPKQNFFIDATFIWMQDFIWQKYIWYCAVTLQTEGQTDNSRLIKVKYFECVERTASTARCPTLKSKRYYFINS